MKSIYEEKLEHLSKEPASYQISVENLSTDRRLTGTELGNIFTGYNYFLYSRNAEKPYKRRIFVHTRSYYLPEFIRGMTDTVKNIWINSKEYFKGLVLRHEKIHVAHPEWSEELVREFDEFYEPYLPDVEFVYV